MREGEKRRGKWEKRWGRSEEGGRDMERAEKIDRTKENVNNLTSGQSLIKYLNQFEKLSIQRRRKKEKEKKKTQKLNFESLSKWLSLLRPNRIFFFFLPLPLFSTFSS